MAQGDVTCNLTNALPKRCAVFDGVDDYVEVADDDSLDFRLNSFSAFFWFRQTNLTEDSRMLSKPKGTSVNGWSFTTENTTSKLFFRTNSTIFRSDVIGDMDGDWHHAGFILNRITNVVHFYWDGSPNGTAAFTEGAVDMNNADNLSIGRRESNSYTKGGMADVRIYNRVLSEDEIKQLYQGRNITDGIVLNMPLSENYEDKSPYGNDGTNHGSYLTTVDDQVSKAISDARVTANDKYLMAVVNNKIMTSVIEEA